MKTTKIQFNGRSYYSRIVESVDGEELLIGSTILLDALQPGSFNDENEGFASKEAERIYDEIFFFTDERTLQLPENELIAELKKDKLRIMEKEYVMQVAQTIKEQLVALTPMTVLMSWGIKEFAATLYRDLPALRIKVNGRLHAGYVIVALNGSDYYEVYLVKGMEVECVNEEVCFDELGDVIDRAIESGTDKAEYDKFCEQERQNLYVTVVTV